MQLFLCDILHSISLKHARNSKYFAYTRKKSAKNLQISQLSVNFAPKC